MTLRLPPPLDEVLRLDDDGRVWDDHALVAEARAAPVGLSPPDPVVGDALAAERTSTRRSRNASCAAQLGLRGRTAHLRRARCRPRRLRGDLDRARIHLGPEFAWVALDCAGAYATGAAGRGTVVLARLTARVDRVPGAGERCVVVGWHLDSEGRKHGAGTALFTDTGELLGIAKALWVEPRQ